jgi:rhomboid protease GluP
MGRLKVCNHCRAFFDATLKSCPECGVSTIPREMREKGGTFDRLASRGAPVHMLVIGVNVALYVICVVMSGGFRNVGGFLGIGAVDIEVIWRLGALSYRPVVEGGEWWRLVCPVFLHFSLIHILFNCYAIRVAGQIAEHAYGPAKFLALFVLMGLCGSVASLVWNGEGLWVGAGASGAAFGVIGLAGVYGVRSGNDAIRRAMFQWAAFVLIFGFVSRGAVAIDNAAHIGGLISGIGFGYTFHMADRTRLRARAVRAWDVAAIAGVALVVASFTFAVLSPTPG